jgi:Zn-dependent protease/predicted transcriptional regulator
MTGRGRQAAGERGFLSHSLVLGTIAGTKIRLHWTFGVFLIWLGAAFLVAGGPGTAASGLALVVAVFACVVAHEFGHITMARRYGFASPDVTLLPIGGVARFRTMPERPSEELAVALAGPAVNVAIAAVLVLLLGVTPESPSLDNVEAGDVLPALAAINLFLALFNLVPAFPMDGGRVLRAVLAMRLERERATRLAAHVGQTIAVGFGLLGLFGGNPILVLIALFVYFAASAEAQDAQLHRLARQMRVADAMASELRPLSAGDTLADAVRVMLSTEQREFPVVDGDEALLGVLTREGLVHGLHSHGPELPVAKAMLEGLPTFAGDRPLEDALPLMESDPRPVVVLDRAGRWAGLLTRETLGELLLLSPSR